MSNGIRFDEYKKKKISNSKLKKEYEKTKSDYDVILDIAGERKKLHITQQKLADMTGIDRADISRIENAEANPTIGTLKKIAKALDRKLVIEFKK